MTTQEKLARITNYGTRYELIATNLTKPEGHQNILIGYIIRRSRQGMLDACRKFGREMIDVMGLDEHDLSVFDCKAKTLSLGNNWFVRLTGRTQRTAIIEGELPFIVDEWKAIDAGGVL